MKHRTHLKLSLAAQDLKALIPICPECSIDAANWNPTTRTLEIFVSMESDREEHRYESVMNINLDKWARDGYPRAKSLKQPATTGQEPTEVERLLRRNTELEDQAFKTRIAVRDLMHMLIDPANLDVNDIEDCFDRIKLILDYENNS